MIILGLLILFCAYIVLAIAITNSAARLLPRPASTIVAVLFVCLPFADALAGRALLRSRCASDGKIVIKEKVSGAEGIADDLDTVFEDSPSYYGYRWIESSPHFSGMVDRAISTGDRKAVIEKNVEPKAKYRLHTGYRQDSLYFFKTRISVRTTDTGHELSRFDWFEFRGGWVEYIFMLLTDAGPRPVAECGNFDVRHRKEIELLHATVPPL